MHSFENNEMLSDARPVSSPLSARYTRLTFTDTLHLLPGRSDAHSITLLTTAHELRAQRRLLQVPLTQLVIAIARSEHSEESAVDNSHLEVTLTKMGIRRGQWPEG